MAYPLVPMPTLGEFIARATTEFAATLQTTARDPVGPRGPARIRYLQRSPGMFAILPDLADTDPLTPSVLHTLCDQLSIPPETFGLTLE